jgi:hypothetical protein
MSGTSRSVLLRSFALALALGAPSVSSGQPTDARTLLTVRAPIDALAQDGRWIAWAAPGQGVHLLHATTRKKARVRSRNLGVDVHGYFPSLALSGSRVLFASYRGVGNTAADFYVITAGLRGRERLLHYQEDFDHPWLDEEGRAVPSWPLAGDGTTIVFGAKGRLYRLIGQRKAQLPRDRFGHLLAVSGPRYASARLKSEGGCICSLEPTWSPDGRFIAYTANRELHEESRTGDSRVNVVAANGGRPRTIARGARPDWSPDGSLIAFERALPRRPGTRVYVIGTNGSGERTLTTGEDPDWSPDGSKIAFVRANAGIHVVSRDGTGVRRVTRGVEPAWSPDGSRIAFADGAEIWVANADGTGRRQLTRSGHDIVEAQPAWSPDGRRIAFTRLEENFVFGPIDAQLMVVNADGSGLRKLDTPRRGLDPAWSPDGSRIAFAGWLPHRHPVRRTLSTELFTVAVDGSQEAGVTSARPAEPRTTGFVRSLRTRKRTALAADGAVRDLVLTPTAAALLVETFAGKSVRVYDPASGRLRRSVEVPRETGNEIAGAANRIVYSVGREIRTLDVRGGQSRTVARAALVPAHLSLEGRRLVWVENTRTRGRIRTVTLSE